ncbi:MAG: tetraacyldisaccharide 4'-kinase [bacterium]|nr:tetraacyldisaccharide 4'-kinase [bacterium]
MPILKWVLYPFSMVYRLVTDFRNHLYNIEYSKSFEFEANVIAVGNLSVGGTGKTPMVEYLIRLLSDKFQVATLSRGYGRKSRGFLEASENSKVEEIGDEPFQMHLKYGAKVSVNVIEQRAWGIPNILMNNENTDVIILDDAFQHRTVVPSLSILLTTYERPFYNDMLLPSGRLRERRKNANRSDVVVITKCPDTLSNNEQTNITSKVNRYCDSPVLFTGLKYEEPKAFYNEDKLELVNDLVTVSGIADDKHFVSYVESNWKILKHFRYSDHHRYNEKTVKKIADFARQNGASILVTEKDFTKLRDFKSEWRNLRIFYLPMEVYFLNNKETFDQLILGSIKKYSRIGHIDAE